MWPLDSPDPTDPPGQPATVDLDDSDDLTERRVRHRSEDIEIFIVSDDEDAPLLPLPNTRTLPLSSQAEVPKETGTDDAGCRLRKGLGIDALGADGGRPSTCFS